MVMEGAEAVQAVGFLDRHPQGMFTRCAEEGLKVKGPRSHGKSC